MIIAYISGMNKKDRIHLLKQLDQKAFQSDVANLWPLARGSLTLIRKPCVRPACPACAKGGKHSAYILMARDKGSRRCLYVPRELMPLLRQALRNGKVLERRLSRMAMQLILAYCAQRRQRASPFAKPLPPSRKRFGGTRRRDTSVKSGQTTRRPR